MEETQAKYHHLIPQTYMSFWANEAGTLQIEFFNNPGIIKPRNKENIAGINRLPFYQSWDGNLHQR